jgi:membrane protease YdiL (CAAX protease family)
MPDNARPMDRLGLALELVLLFVGIPAAMARRLVPRAPIPVLLVAAAGCSVVLMRDPSFDRTALWNARGAREYGVAMLLGFVQLAVALTALVAWRAPASLFDLVLSRPLLWALVMVLYPLVSVYPQEIIYRAFFFHRYAPLLPDTASRVAVSALVFAFGHVFFPRPWIAMGLTFAGGVLFGWHYAESRSLLLASIEHALFGQLMFTIGLGRFFYHGGDSP